MKIYMLTSQPYYCSINQCYRQILVLNQKPTGPLYQISKRINPPKLSPFKEISVCCNQPTCIWAIKSPDNKCDLMCVEELPMLFQFLMNNGYIIDTSITKMMNESSVKLNNPMICYISYNE
jgi:hypothetical protein